MKKISIVSSCYNEELNIEEFYNRCKKEIEKLKDRYEFEFIVADNASTDKTAEKLCKIAENDKSFKVILNSRNFGQLRSPFYAMQQAYGDAIISLTSDLQDPPELIPQLIKKWEEGYEAVMLQKNTSDESKLMFFLRKIYYNLFYKLNDSGVELAKNCTGTGLYDKKIIDFFRTIDDTVPFIRGLICEAGFNRTYLQFKQPKREKGISTNNFYTLYDLGISGIIKYSKVPLHAMTIIGFLATVVSIILITAYLVLKFLNYSTFELGFSAILLGMLFIGSIQLFCFGILGEYLAIIYSRVDKKPLVTERERINFD